MTRKTKAKELTLTVAHTPHSLANYGVECRVVKANIDPLVKSVWV